jgi:hypothetical protein
LTGSLGYDIMKKLEKEVTSMEENGSRRPSTKENFL